MAQLQQAMDLIDFKVAVYEDLLDRIDGAPAEETGERADSGR
jgi:hypothetical protein